MTDVTITKLLAVDQRVRLIRPWFGLSVGLEGTLTHVDYTSVEVEWETPEGPAIDEFTPGEALRLLEVV